MSNSDLRRYAFTQSDVIRMTGIPAKTLQNWTSRGLIQLDDQNPGWGSRRQYRFEDLVEVMILHALTSLGVSASPAAKIAGEIVAFQMATIVKAARKPLPPKNELASRGLAYSARVIVKAGQSEIMIRPTGSFAEREDETSQTELVGAYIHVNISEIIYHARHKALILLKEENASIVLDNDPGEQEEIDS